MLPDRRAWIRNDSAPLTTSDRDGEAWRRRRRSQSSTGPRSCRPRTRFDAFARYAHSTRGRSQVRRSLLHEMAGSLAPSYGRVPRDGLERESWVLVLPTRKVAFSGHLRLMPTSGYCERVWSRFHLERFNRGSRYSRQCANSTESGQGHCRFIPRRCRIVFWRGGRFFLDGWSRFLDGCERRAGFGQGWRCAVLDGPVLAWNRAVP